MEVLAPAKVNFGLSILGKLPNGYHQLHTIFASLSVGDRLWLEPIPQGIQLSVQGAKLSAGSDNLAYRAAQAYLNAAGWPGGIKITLEKNLPLAAGLGGGSSDAAAVLKALAELYPAHLKLVGIAQSLGADVPFFLGGNLAEGHGIGEKLTPLPPIQANLVLVNPGIPMAAATAYQHLKPEEWQPELDVLGILRAIGTGEEPYYWNTLEQPVFRLQPYLAELKIELRRAGLQGVLMSGSGSTVFGLAKDAGEADFIAAKLRERHPGFWIMATQTV